MDTLFRLVSHHQSSDHHQQQSSLNSSRTSTTSDRSPFFFLPQDDDDEECGNTHHPSALSMDDDLSSSSSPSKHLLPPPPPTSSHFSSPPTLHHFLSNPNPHRRWAPDLLLACARAAASRDGSLVQHLLWALNELSSPFGDLDQKLASYFLQALFSRLTSSGRRTLRTLSSASDRAASFDSTRRTLLRFQELSPWSSFGHVAANGAILESFLDAAGDPAAPTPARLHILDLSSTFCTQWPTLLEALATRSADDTPHLSITTVVPSAAAGAQRVMREIGARMEKFARLMGVPFRFSVIHHPADADLSAVDIDCLVDGGSALAVNCVNSLRNVSPAGRRREALLAKIRRLRPRVVTLVEEEADLSSDAGDGGDEGFLKGFEEALRFFSAYFDSLEESFPKTSNERLALERAAGRAVVDLVACAATESTERRDTAAGWSRRMRHAGFSPAEFSEDVSDDVRALLRRYREGWSMRPAVEEADESSSSGGGEAAGIFLSWKEQPVVWASAWKP